MHERRPPALTQVLAAQSLTRDYDDLRYPGDIVISTHSRQSSQSTASDSSPATPTSTFTRGHSRHTSSSSSVTYTPTLHDSFDSTIVRKPNQSLPDVAEEPLESLDHPMMDRLPDPLIHNHGLGLHDGLQRWSIDYQPHSMLTPPAEQDFRSEYFYYCDAEDERLSKRRRSGTLGTLARGIVRRIPSMTRPSKDRRSLSRSNSAARDAYPPSATPSRASSQSSSRRVMVREASIDSCAVKQTSIFEPIEEDLTDAQDGDQAEPQETLPQAKTPLLHPLIVDVSAQALDYQSPLQSPAVAPPTSTTVSVANTPAGTPQVRSMPSPPLSTKPSMASMHRAARPGGLVPQADIPPMLISESSDEWADKLGHANYDIDPEPFMPEPCDLAAHQDFINQWELARAEYSKHLARTSTHYGPNSEIYALTQEKWAHIERQWKSFNDAALAKLGQTGQLSYHGTPIEPAPVVVIPVFDELHSDGKFPKLGDEDIVGPMIQATAVVQRQPSKRDRFLTAIGNLQSPMRVLKRSFTSRTTSGV